MAEYSESVSDHATLTRQEMLDAAARLEAQRRQESATSLTLLYELRRKERREQHRGLLKSWWPLGARLVLSAFAPLIRAVAHLAGEWVVNCVFPFVVLAERPEMQAGPITQQLPAIMLYAQFSIEGLLARLILRRHVPPLGVAFQVALFHVLGIAELWLLSGGARASLGR